MQSIVRIFFKEKRLGSTQGKRQYDLPLNKTTGTNFLILLIALMTFLIAMASTGSFAINAMTEAWSSGLENKATIEIPAEKSDGTLRTKEQISAFTADVAKSLARNGNIKDFEILDQNDIAELVSPWLGDDMVLNEIPLPGLISLELNNSDSETIDTLVQSLALINDNIRLDTHEGWLGQLLRVTNSLQFGGAFVIIIIAITTITAIAGGVRSRMAIHRADIELLHLMGASDDYITKQFQRHALIIASKGSLLGAFTALCALAIIGYSQISSFSHSDASSYLTLTNSLILIATPLLACFISAITARATVMRELGQMP